MSLKFRNQEPGDSDIGDELAAGVLDAGVEEAVLEKNLSKEDSDVALLTDRNVRFVDIPMIYHILI